MLAFRPATYSLFTHKQNIQTRSPLVLSFQSPCLLPSILRSFLPHSLPTFLIRPGAHTLHIHQKIPEWKVVSTQALLLSSTGRERTCRRINDAPSSSTESHVRKGRDTYPITQQYRRSSAVPSKREMECYHCRLLKPHS